MTLLLSPFKQKKVRYLTFKCM